MSHDLNRGTPRVPPRLIAIVGGSGAGKTWLAGRLERALGGAAARLSLDDFYRDRSHLPPARRARINFDHPRTMDWPLVEQVLSQCRSGRAVALPRYDFATHTRLAQSRSLAPGKALLIDGLWLLRRRSVRRLFDLSIFVDCPAGLRLQRRLARDLRQRGRTAGSVKRQFRENVEPMHARFVASQRRLADVVVPQPAGRADWQRVLARVKTLLCGAPDSVSPTHA